MSNRERIPTKLTSKQGNLWHRFVRFGFRLLYHELAWSYDSVAWLVSFGRWKEWGQTALTHIRGHKILELGSGPGHLLVAMAERGFHPVGLDRSQQMVRLARRRLSNMELPLNLVSGYAQFLPFPNGSFSSVVSTFPTTYLFDPATLAEVARVLRPNGRLIAVIGTRFTGTSPLGRLAEWLYSVTGQTKMKDTEWCETLLAENGFTVHRFEIQMRRSQVFLLVAEYATLDDRNRRNAG